MENQNTRKSLPLARRLQIARTSLMRRIEDEVGEGVTETKSFTHIDVRPLQWVPGVTSEKLYIESVVVSYEDNNQLVEYVFVNPEGGDVLWAAGSDPTAANKHHNVNEAIGILNWVHYLIALSVGDPQAEKYQQYAETAYKHWQMNETVAN